MHNVGYLTQQKVIIMSDEPKYGTKITNDSKEAADKVSEHASKAAEAAAKGNVGEAVNEALKVIGYAAQSAGHTVEGN
jgi:ArsR family metal-binding transcriptional regulator